MYADRENATYPLEIVFLLTDVRLMDADVATVQRQLHNGFGATTNLHYAM